MTDASVAARDELLDGLTPGTVAGQAVYSPRTLKLYDWLVLGFSNRFAWRCPTRELREMYDRHVTANHLEVGVGTGYFLDRCRFPVGNPRVVLMDLNEDCLQTAADRIRRYRPEMVRANVLEPVDYSGGPFDSIGVNYVLHCLPGTMAEKAVVFDHLGRLLSPGGVLFGSTLLGEGVQHNLLARRLMAVYNRRGIFCNTADTLDGLRTALQTWFGEWDVRVVGCAALFWARS
ncbi:MAG: class I SAM-dependent methyltransferase [Planctomycetaceae bacterium]